MKVLDDSLQVLKNELVTCAIGSRPGRAHMMYRT